jgi:hypothetical protein
MIRRSFTNSLDQNGNLRDILSVPGVEGLEKLQTVRSGRNSNIDRGAVFGRGLVRVLARVIAARGETIAGRRLELFECKQRPASFARLHDLTLNSLPSFPFRVSV